MNYFLKIFKTKQRSNENNLCVAQLAPEKAYEFKILELHQNEFDVATKKLGLDGWKAVGFTWSNETNSKKGPIKIVFQREYV